MTHETDAPLGSTKTDTRDHRSAFTELRRLSPRVTGGLLRMRQEAYRDGHVPGKYKVLSALGISIAIRCEPCIRAYVQQAIRKGASQQELVEFLEVAMTMQGCPGEEWALKAFAAYTEMDAGPTQSAGRCCEAHLTDPAAAGDIS